MRDIMIKHSPHRRQPIRRLGTFVSLLCVIAGALLPAGAGHVALAAAPVTYDAFNDVIYVGDDYNPSDPVQAPFVGYPSHPQAPKTPISIPEVAAALNNPALLQDQGGGAWLLKANLVIRQAARLEATK